MVFTGTYEHAIDKKNRLAIPADIRGQIQRSVGAAEGDSVYLYVTLGDDQALSLYTEQGFEQRARELDDSELEAGDLLAYERLLFSLARRVELDRQGRVRLPDNLLKQAGLGAEVVLLGVKDHLEVRDRQSWQEYVQQMLKSQPQMLMNPRRAMRSPRTSAT
ncbi:division/cell wall cluster transcriptional repressor MraZ [Phycisphaerales bacterium AB-hyl4]|uniref:Transcriptional regulator MraZ n=1 Tax=Natronomicrosphaera hydrolytica TaxID=3242702 RepID=A0ABV4U072_9BACT